MAFISNLRLAVIRSASLVAVSFLFIHSDIVLAQIYNWQTDQVIPGTQNITPGPGIELTDWDTAGHELEYAELGNLNLSGAQLEESDFTSADFGNSNLSQAYLGSANLTGAILANANLSNVTLSATTLTNANFSGTIINGADLGGSGISAEQLYSTASYQNGDLSYVYLSDDNVAGWNFAGKNLTNSSFYGSNVTGADFTGATITGAQLDTYPSFAAQQLYSTASYQTGNLSKIVFEGDKLSGWDFTNQNMAGCNFWSTNLTGANFTGANINAAAFRDATGFTASQLYSTASYQSGNLGAINFQLVDVSYWNFAGQNLAGAEFNSAEYANFTNANLVGVDFDGYCSNSNFSNANLTGASIGQGSAGANFSNANLTNAGVYGDTSDAIFTGATITGATIDFATLSQLYSTVNYQEDNLSGISLGGPSMAGSNFANFNLTKATLDSDFTGANLSNANLSNATFEGNFTNANLTGAIITGISLVTGNPFTESQFDSTASFQNGNLSGISCEYGSFIEWNLAGKNLSGAYFYSTVLDGVNFSNANLTGSACGKYVSFVGANFSGANLTGAIFGIDAFEAGFPDFSKANFVNANLTNTDFASCDLSNADFRGATFSNTGFSACNLYRANFSGDYFDTGTIFGGAPGFDGAETSMNEANFFGAHVYLPSLVSVNPTDVDFAGAFFSGSGGPGFYFDDDDLRGATGWPSSGIIIQNSILPNGTIPSLALGANELLVIRNNSMAIHVSPTATFNATSTLQFWLEGNWTSPIIFDLGVVPSLAGTLDLEFAEGVDPSTLLGQTFELFDFIDPLGSWDTFSSITTVPGLVWDTSQLYTNGTVTLLAVPEPVMGGLVAAGMIAMSRRRK